MFPAFNLGPLFLLDNLAKKIFDLKKREYIYKKTKTGHLSSHFSDLSDVTEGSAVATYRRLQVEKAHLPTSIWEM